MPQSPPPDPSVQDPKSAESRRRPSRGWYLLAGVMFLGSLGVFGGALVSKAKVVNDRIEQMPRFVGPTQQGAVVELTEPGLYTIFHENLGEFEGQRFETPRRQVWPTMASPAMTCSVFDVDADEAIQVRLPGADDQPKDRREINQDVIPTYDTAGRQGHGVWLFNVIEPGQYRINVAYVPEVLLAMDDVEIPAELTREQKREITSDQGKAYAADRRAAEERMELARLEPMPVLFAVGQDPSRGTFFNLIGMRGAAGVLAFGFTASVIIALVTLMLRGGHVTERGQLSDVQRGLRG